MITGIILLVIALAIYLIGRNVVTNRQSRKACDIVALVVALIGALFIVLWLVDYARASHTDPVYDGMARVATDFVAA